MRHGRLSCCGVSNVGGSATLQPITSYALDCPSSDFVKSETSMDCEACYGGKAALVMCTCKKAMTGSKRSKPGCSVDSAAVMPQCNSLRIPKQTKTRNPRSKHFLVQPAPSGKTTSISAKLESITQLNSTFESFARERNNEALEIACNWPHPTNKMFLVMDA